MYWTAFALQLCFISLSSSTKKFIFCLFLFLQCLKNLKKLHIRISSNVDLCLGLIPTATRKITKKDSFFFLFYLEDTCVYLFREIAFHLCFYSTTIRNILRWIRQCKLSNCSCPLFIYEIHTWLQGLSCKKDKQSSSGVLPIQTFTNAIFTLESLGFKLVLQIFFIHLWILETHFVMYMKICI